GGLREVELMPLGGGVFSAVYLFIDRLLPRILRFFNYYSFRYATALLDVAIAFLARRLGKKYAPEDYAFGYAAIGKKP
ncbi:hypothetical protein KW797_04925, partial [Candidatus Parcubacteria bacterium]|nr:hypothetical protein [Candidatus Parcubacteria bacterium]